MSEEPSKYDGYRKTLKSRRRDDHALDLFREAEASLDDVQRVDRILRELGRFYNPLSNAPVVELAARRRIVELLEAGERDTAQRLLDGLLSRYAKIERPGESP